MSPRLIFSTALFIVAMPACGGAPFKQKTPAPANHSPSSPQSPVQGLPSPSLLGSWFAPCARGNISDGGKLTFVFSMDNKWALDLIPFKDASCTQPYTQADWDEQLAADVQRYESQGKSPAEAEAQAQSDVKVAQSLTNLHVGDGTYAVGKDLGNGLNALDLVHTSTSGALSSTSYLSFQLDENKLTINFGDRCPTKDSPYAPCVDAGEDEAHRATEGPEAYFRN